MKAWFILRELFFLLLFLGVLYAISFANRDVESAHHMVNYLRKEFLQVDYNSEYRLKERKKNFMFENIQTMEDYWQWLENVFVDKYLPTKWNDTQKNKTLLSKYNRANKIIGWPILRQLRVKNGN